MIKTYDPKVKEKPIARCAECDEEVTRYFALLSPTNEIRNICWRCKMRKEKGFNAKRSFSRLSRNGVIPR